MAKDKKNLKLFYGVVGGAGYDTEKMTPTEVIEKYKKLTAGELKERLQQKLSAEKLIVKDAEEEEQKKRIGDYVERFREGEEVESKIVLSDVGEKEREYIEKLTGEKLTATQHVLCLSELRHIEKRHGRHGEHDHSMADMEKYKQIIEVLKNPDSVDFCLDKKGERQYSYNYRDKNNRPAKLLTFTKVYDGYEQMVVEAVCDSKYGKLHVITCYIKK